jgi:hypothetical protein
MSTTKDAGDPNRELEYGETQPPRNDVKEQRGGPQADQITGQTDKGAHNRDIKGRNPQANKEETATKTR